MNKYSRIYRYAPLLLWVALIFFFSSTAASANQTSRIIGPILQLLFPSSSAETIQQYHFFIRKCAHFTEYALLAFWTIRALAGSSLKMLKHYRFIIAIVLVFTVASIDEFNQSFEPTRTSSVWDVLLDCIGGLTASLLMWLLFYWSNQPATVVADHTE